MLDGCALSPSLRRSSLAPDACSNGEVPGGRKRYSASIAHSWHIAHEGLTQCCTLFNALELLRVILSHTVGDSPIAKRMRRTSPLPGTSGIVEQSDVGCLSTSSWVALIVHRKYVFFEFKFD